MPLHKGLLLCKLIMHEASAFVSPLFYKKYHQVEDELLLVMYGCNLAEVPRSFLARSSSKPAARRLDNGVLYYTAYTCLYQFVDYESASNGSAHVFCTH